MHSTRIFHICSPFMTAESRLLATDTGEKQRIRTAFIRPIIHRTVIHRPKKSAHRTAISFSPTRPNPPVTGRIPRQPTPHTTKSPSDWKNQYTQHPLMHQKHPATGIKHPLSNPSDAQNIQPVEGSTI